MTLAGFVTYDDVAETLPVDVREAIEVEAPCAGGFAHLWDNQQNWVEQFGKGIVRTDEWWQCVHCRAVSHDDPRDAVERERPLASAHLEDFL